MVRDGIVVSKKIAFGEARFGKIDFVEIAEAESFGVEFDVESLGAAGKSSASILDFSVRTRPTICGA